MENEGLGNPLERGWNNEDHSTRRGRKRCGAHGEQEQKHCGVKGMGGEEKGNKLEITEMEYEERKTPNAESKGVLEQRGSSVQSAALARCLRATVHKEANHFLPRQKKKNALG